MNPFIDAPQGAGRFLKLRLRSGRSV